MEVGGNCVTADYGAVEGRADEITVANTVYPLGKQVRVGGYAVANPGKDGEFQVNLGPPGFPKDPSKPEPFSGSNYVVAALGPIANGKYDYSVVTDPARASLYILARDAVQFEKTYEADVLEIVKNMGFTGFSNKPRKTNQEGCTYSDGDSSQATGTVPLTEIPSLYGYSLTESLTVFDFSNPASSPVSWYEVPDPVMGGHSSGNFTVLKDGFGRFQASVVNISGVLKAPGFVKIITCPQPVTSYGVCKGEKAFLNVSAFGQFKLRARTSTPTYKGFRFAFGPGKGLFSTGYKQDFNVGEEWTDVALPFNKFSSATSPATGEPTKRCEDDESVCPSKDVLAGITELAIWAEGAAGEITLDIEWIKAESQAHVDTSVVII